MRCLLRAGADKELADGAGVTPLWAAAARGHAPIVQCLLAEGVGLDEASCQEAAARGHSEVVQLFRDAGVSVREPEPAEGDDREDRRSPDPSMEQPCKRPRHA